MIPVEAPARRRRGRRRPLTGSAFVVVAASLVAALAPVAAQGVPIELVNARQGTAVYAANCASCHQVMGTGFRSAVPPLLGTVPALLGAEGGREYLLSVVLDGTSGELLVEGERYDGLMPSWNHLSDAQLAAVLNHVATAWRNVELLPAGTAAFTPLEVALARTRVKSPGEVLRSRPQVDP